MACSGRWCAPLTASGVRGCSGRSRCWAGWWWCSRVDRGAPDPRPALALRHRGGGRDRGHLRARRPRDAAADRAPRRHRAVVLHERLGRTRSSSAATSCCTGTARTAATTPAPGWSVCTTSTERPRMPARDRRARPLPVLPRHGAVRCRRAPAAVAVRRRPVPRDALHARAAAGGDAVTRPVPGAARDRRRAGREPTVGARRLVRHRRRPRACWRSCWRSPACSGAGTRARWR